MPVFAEGAETGDMTTVMVPFCHAVPLCFSATAGSRTAQHSGICTGWWSRSNRFSMARMFKFPMPPMRGRQKGGILPNANDASRIGKEDPLAAGADGFDDAPAARSGDLPNPAVPSSVWWHASRRLATTLLTVCSLSMFVRLVNAESSTTEANADSGLPMAQLQAGIHRIRAEVAATETSRERGLMWRQDLARNSGMLFVFNQPGRYCFWMKNTLIPLSIAFLDDDGHIVTLAEMEAGSEEPHCPSQTVRYALEMNKGWFVERGLTRGASVTGLPR